MTTDADATPSQPAPEGILSPEALRPATDLLQQALAQLDAILLGRTDLHRLVLVGMASRGHILLEGVPGVGKTALIKTLGQLFNLEFKRVQFTPDLMPGDILGAHILQQTASGTREMIFQPGPIFTNILLADEINRASPKTQSALLEAMQERHVTLLGVTRPLPEPFFVLASQNPIELEGTYPLPEAQLDRFLFKLQVGCPDPATLERIIGTRRQGVPPAPATTVTPDQLQMLFRTMDRIFLPRPVARYIARLVGATHPDGAEATPAVKRFVSYGASPRAAIAMAEAARAVALMAGRPTVGFEDVRAVALPALNHRVLLNYQARFEKVAVTEVVQSLLDTLEVTGAGWPDSLRVGKEQAAHA
ncbi:MAG: AAA family ATPase [Candidatus Ozemobacter sibiricus]|jgi:MoxR-like ATPase|uniref:AAA family ATPase n=1 Tax=Candidatus Ozemobacter sibiricus TaxID=2268124 RepID=A0A367ZQ44_9BACT|nr:MAG: AAA family ATPase [Candidatus Ozemobacter sibiricus]